MEFYRGSVVTLLICVCLAVGVTTAAHAQDGTAEPAADQPVATEQPDAPPASMPMRVAVVDVQLISRVYVKPQAQDEKTAEWARRKQQYVNELQNRYMYLSEEAFNDVLDILAMAPPRSAQAAKKLKDLQDVNDKNEARYLDLQRKVNRTPEEQDEFNRLQTEFDGREARVKQIVDDLQKQLEKMQLQTVKQAMQTAQGAIRQSADELGYHLVFSRGAVLVGGDDITDAVLARLGVSRPTAADDATPTGTE